VGGNGYKIFYRVIL